MSLLWTVCYATKRTNNVHSIAISPMRESRCGLIWPWQNLLLDHCWLFFTIFRSDQAHKHNIQTEHNHSSEVYFSHYGVPATLFSDNGPQFASAEMEEFSKSYSFDHITGSPHYPNINGLVERTIKGELLMGRQIRTDVPETTKHFIPDWHFLAHFKEKDKDIQEETKTELW